MGPTRVLATGIIPPAVELAPSAVLGLLANMYLCQPTAEAVGNWREIMSRGAEPLSRLSDALEQIEATSSEEMDDLLWDYTRLFVGPYRLPCPPWESVYTSQKRLLLQEAADGVETAYARLGVQLGAPNVLPDHVGAELNFMGILLEKVEADPKEKEACRQLAKSFLEEHLANWIPRFASDIEKAAETTVYKALAQATTRTLDQTAALLIYEL